MIVAFRSLSHWIQADGFTAPVWKLALSFFPLFIGDQFDCRRKNRPGSSLTSRVVPNVIPVD